MNNKYIFNKWRAYYPYLILFLGAFIVLLATPLAPFANKLTNVDSNVYIYCSEQILNGKIMYKELFDHKGPMLYVFNVIGLLIGGKNTTGIWLIELILLFVSLVYIFKSASIYFDRLIALISTLFSLFLIMLLLVEGQGGNCTEEYAIPFISVSMYYFLLFLKQQIINKYHFVIIACCCICTFLLKPNFISLWLVGYFFVFIILLKNKKLKKLLPISVTTIITFLVICIPFSVYFTLTDSWSDFKFCFWDFNKSYSDVSFIGILSRTIKRVWYAGHFWLSLIGRIHVVLFIFVGIVYFKYMKDKIEAFFLFFAIILTLVMISIGILFDLLHYYLPFAPLFVFLYAFVCHFLIKKTTINPMLIAGLLFLLFSFGCIRQLKSTYKKQNPLENLITFIKENSEKTDKITVVGHDCSIYNLSGRESVSKYSYIFPIASVKQYGAMIAENYMKDIENRKPRIIITITSSDYNEYFPMLHEILNTNYEEFILPDTYQYYSCWLRK